MADRFSYLCEILRKTLISILKTRTVTKVISIYGSQQDTSVPVKNASRPALSAVRSLSRCVPPPVPASTADQTSATSSCAGIPSAQSSCASPGASQVADVQLAQDTELVAQASSEGSGAEYEEVDSEEPDNSGDEDWSYDEGAVVEEQLTGESAESAAEGEDQEDISINLTDVDVQQCVTTLIREDECDKVCLKGKAAELEWLVCSLDQLSKTEKTTCILTLLGVLMQTDTVERRRGSGARDKFHYYLPFVGKVCRPSFARCLGVQPLTLQRYKRRVREGNIAPKPHGNKLNKNAAKVDLVWLVKWFKRFADEVGEVVPVRVRMQKTKDGVVKKYYSREDYTLLPATFTWDRLFDEMHKYVSLGLRVREPAPSTFRKLLSLHCPTIKIRASQSNVCDMCSIYQTRMRRGATAEQTEELGQHTESARRMRREYKKDKAAIRAVDGSNNDTAVLVMDYSQNLTIPSVTSTPSQWYFCSLLSVSVFGIVYENDGTQTNYLYDEFTSGKGIDQINSMLQHFIDTVLLPAGKKRLVMYADNCSGQNKNNFVIKFFLAQVQMGVFERIDYKFFVKGHTKNSCDRGFGHIRKHVGRSDCWTMDQIIAAVKDSATSNTTVRISREDSFFKSYKPIMSELYKTLVGVQQFQLFSMEEGKPGVVACKKGPDDEPAEQDLRGKVDGVLTESVKVNRMMTHFVEKLSPPPPNAEKMTDIYNKIRPYVPEEHQVDPIYAAPSKQQGNDAKAVKQAHREHRAAMAIAAKKNFDHRGREPSPAPKKRKRNNSETAVV